MHILKNGWFSSSSKFVTQTTFSVNKRDGIIKGHGLTKGHSAAV